MKGRRSDNSENYNLLLALGTILSLLILAGLAFYWGGEDQRLAKASAELTEERVTRAGEVYSRQCVACHGQEGQGGAGPPLKDKSLLENTPDEVFFSVIRSGVPNTQMPAWSVEFGGPLTDEDIRDLVALLNDWEQTAPELAPEQHIPDPSQGAALFANTCAVCHGQNGEGAQEGIPAINNPGRLREFGDEWYRGVIANGRPAQGMPTWGTVLSPEQLDDLVALIAAWRKGAQVAPSFSADELLERAAFALEQGDAESGLLQLGRASEIASGVGAEALANVISQVRSGDLEGAEKTLDLLRERWPMGDPSEGVTAYSASCAPCHGIQGEGGVGPPLQDNAFILSQNNAVLVQFLREGRPGTAMAGFDERLTENQLANITSFLRLWQSSP